eukprot:381689-Prymnesium_polylepis.1
MTSCSPRSAGSARGSPGPSLAEGSAAAPPPARRAVGDGRRAVGDGVSRAVGLQAAGRWVEWVVGAMLAAVRRL